MPVKKAAAPRRASAAKKTPIEIVVRRGATRRFYALKRKTSEMPVTVRWDRRTTERRKGEGAAAVVASERRRADRRKKPPFTWDLADFVVVEPTKRQKKARKRMAKKK